MVYIPEESIAQSIQLCVLQSFNNINSSNSNTYIRTRLNYVKICVFDEGFLQLFHSLLGLPRRTERRVTLSTKGTFSTQFSFVKQWLHIKTVSETSPRSYSLVISSKSVVVVRLYVWLLFYVVLFSDILLSLFNIESDPKFHNAQRILIITEYHSFVESQQAGTLLRQSIIS